MVGNWSSVAYFADKADLSLPDNILYIILHCIQIPVKYPLGISKAQINDTS